MVLRNCAKAVLAACLAFAATAHADGVSAYLPLNLEPEMERQIERVLILADEPILKRPFAVELVEAALPDACKVDEPLCTKVKRYLERYSRDYAVTHASATVSKSKGDDVVLPNQYGLTNKDHWDVSGSAYVQPSDYLLASVGGDAYTGRTSPVGSMVSAGFSWAQIDIGYRPHWLSPLTSTSQLMSTEAPVTPSVTLSNALPITRLGFQYEIFLTELSRSNRILYNNETGTGKPRLLGSQFSIEPFPGWSLGINRNLEYGGADGLPSSASFLAKAYFHPSGTVQLQANQQASYISRFTFPGKTPFAVYFQYGGENTENGGSVLLGQASLSAGIDFPKVARYFDMTYEYAEWQNTWYNHFVFLDGMTNDGLVLGAWGADQRLFNDGVGARSQMLRIGWSPPFGGYLEERIRTVQNQSYSGFEYRQYNPDLIPYPYHRYRDFTLRYSKPWKGLTLGGEFLTGKDVFGKSFSRLSGFVRYGGDEHTRDDGAMDESDASSTPDVKGAERFVDLGVNVTKYKLDQTYEVPVTTTNWKAAPHLGVGARRAVSDHNDLGVRLEVDEVKGHALTAVRALDYRYRYSKDLALTVFGGAARYDLATPAYSLYYGGGGQWRDVLPHWDLNLEYRHAQNVARDHLVSTDIQGGRPDSFYKIDSVLLYVSRRF